MSRHPQRSKASRQKEPCVQRYGGKRCQRITGAWFLWTKAWVGVWKVMRSASSRRARIGIWDLEKERGWLGACHQPLPQGRERRQGLTNRTWEGKSPWSSGLVGGGHEWGGRVLGDLRFLARRTEQMQKEQVWRRGGDGESNIYSSLPPFQALTLHIPSPLSPAVTYEVSTSVIPFDMRKAVKRLSAWQGREDAHACTLQNTSSPVRCPRSSTEKRYPLPLAPPQRPHPRV